MSLAKEPGVVAVLPRLLVDPGPVVHIASSFRFQTAQSCAGLTQAQLRGLSELRSFHNTPSTADTPHGPRITHHGGVYARARARTRVHSARTCPAHSARSCRHSRTCRSDHRCESFLSPSPDPTRSTGPEFRPLARAFPNRDVTGLANLPAVVVVIVTGVSERPGTH